MEFVFDQKYLIRTVLFMGMNGEVTKQDLRKIIKSPSSLDKLLRLLETQDLIEIKERILKRRTYFIKLTAKGERVFHIFEELQSEVNLVF